MNTSTVFVDIAKAIGMSHKEFAELPAALKWYYFHKVHSNLK